jgi:hypothetical protein
LLFTETRRFLTIIHADIVDNWNRNMNQLGVEEMPDDGKRVEPLKNNLPVLV